MIYVDYDTYASMSPLRKNKVLGEITSENKAELVTTHWRRFLEANRARLNAEQIGFIEVSLAYVRPELYQRAQTGEEFNRDREKEETLLRLFSRDDVLKLHMGAFKNSGAIPNPIARALMHVSRRAEEREDLESALCDLAVLPPDQLRQKRGDLPELLGRHIDGIPTGEEFWNQIDDADVRLAARRARGFVHKVKNPIALILSRSVARGGDDLATALRDLAETPINQLHASRPDLPALLARHFEGLPRDEEFWRLAADQDVMIAARRAHLFVTQPWLRAAAPPPPAPPC